MNTLTVIAPSGAPANGTIIQQLDPPGDTSGANRVGFFGGGGPEGVPFAIIVSKYQDKTFITNATGQNLGSAPYGVAGSGELNNSKFVDANTVNVNGQGSVALTGVPQESGTLLIRFEPSGSTAVRTQNAIVRTVPLNASSGIDTTDGVVTGLKMQGFEPGADSAWTQTAGIGTLDNRLFLTDHDVADTIHDFFVSLSISPENIGQRNDFGFFVVIEFL